MTREIKSSSLVPENRTFGMDVENLSVNLNNAYRDLAVATNSRKQGIFGREASISGNKFYGISPDTESSLQRVYSVPSILNGTTTIPHGITNRNDMRLVTLYGGASNPPNNFLPLPYVNVATPTNGILLRIVGNNIEIITTTSDYTGYSAIIIVEYIGR